MQISNCVNSNISEVREQTTNKKTKQDKQTSTPPPFTKKKPKSKQNKKKPPKFGQQFSYCWYIAHTQQSRTGHTDIWAMHGGPQR